MLHSLKMKLCALAALVVASAIATPADAGLTITLQQTGFADLVITDVDNDGAIAFFGAYGDFDIVINTAISNAPGSSTATLDVSNTISRDGDAGSRTLTIIVSDDEFTAPTGTNLTLTSFGSNSGSAGSLTFESFFNATSAGLQGPLTSGMSDTNTILVSPAGTYTLSNTTKITLAANANGGSNGSTQIAAVPEPASMAIWGLGAVCFGVVSAVRRRRSSTPA